MITTEPARPMSATADDPAQQGSCCQGFYEQDWVQQLADNSFHPGGEQLSRRTVDAMNLPKDAAIADLGCGTGTTVMMLVRDYNLRVSALDISAAQIQSAVDRLDPAGELVHFCQAEPSNMPFINGELDGVLAECSFSLFADKIAALAEINRVLKPGGKLAITDMATDGTLPEDIAGVLAPWTCLAGAVDQEAYIQLFQAAEFEIQEVADESASLTSMVLKLKRKLLLGAGAMLANGPIPGFDLATARFWLNRFNEEVENGSIRYLRFNMQKM